MGKHTKDEEILKKIREGDQALLKEIIDQYRAYFFNFFRGKVSYNQEETIGDIYANSFIVLSKKIKNGKIDAPLKASLKTIVVGIGRNFLLKYYEQEKRNRKDYLEDYEQMLELGIDPDVDAYYNQEHNKALIKMMLGKVGDRCRELLILTYLEECKDALIMKKMGFPSLGAIRQKRHKCLKKLRNLFKK